MSCATDEALMTERKRSTDQHGFVLLSVLLVTAVIASMAVATAIVIRAGSRSVAVEMRGITARALADAGLTRAIAALEDAGDPFLAALFAHRAGVSWRFAEHEIRVTLAPEAGKVDLNAGDPVLIANVMRAVTEDEAMSRRLLERLAAVRRSRRDLETVRALLEPRERFSPLAHKLEAAFTVMAGARGIDPLAAPEIVIRSLPDIRPEDLAAIEEARQTGASTNLSAVKARYGALLGGERPLYRLRAEIRLEGQIVRREALAAQDAGTRKVRIVFWRDAEG